MCLEETDEEGVKYPQIEAGTTYVGPCASGKIRNVTRSCSYSHTPVWSAADKSLCGKIYNIK